jgi:hypothetical protein
MISTEARTALCIGLTINWYLLSDRLVAKRKRLPKSRSVCGRFKDDTSFAICSSMFKSSAESSKSSCPGSILGQIFEAICRESSMEYQQREYRANWFKHAADLSSCLLFFSLNAYSNFGRQPDAEERESTYKSPKHQGHLYVVFPRLAYHPVWRDFRSRIFV